MEKKNWQRVLITIFVVIIGLGGIIWLTWKMGDFFIGLLSVDSVNRYPAVQQVDEEILILPRISVWTCRTGLYQESENARKAVDSLKVRGWKAGVIQEKPFAVAIGIYGTREKAVLQNNILQKKGINSLVKNQVFPELHYKARGKDIDKITGMLKLANSLLNGKDREALRREPESGYETLHAGCPKGFEHLNGILDSMFSPGYKGDYNQDLMDLFLAYKEITIKYLGIKSAS